MDIDTDCATPIVSRFGTDRRKDLGRKILHGVFVTYRLSWPGSGVCTNNTGV
jgi:hypothetical protein